MSKMIFFTNTKGVINRPCLIGSGNKRTTQYLRVRPSLNIDAEDRRRRAVASHVFINFINIKINKNMCSCKCVPISLVCKFYLFPRPFLLFSRTAANPFPRIRCAISMPQLFCFFPLRFFFSFNIKGGTHYTTWRGCNYYHQKKMKNPHES